MSSSKASMSPARSASKSRATVCLFRWLVAIAVPWLLKVPRAPYEGKMRNARRHLEVTTMHGPLFDVYDANCPSRTALNRIGDRWTALIVGVLSQRAHRFGELRRRIDGISQKML